MQQQLVAYHTTHSINELYELWRPTVIESTGDGVTGRRHNVAIWLGTDWIWLLLLLVTGELLE